MRRALIFQGALVCGTVVTIFGLKGHQARRERDEQVLLAAEQAQPLQS